MKMQPTPLSFNKRMTWYKRVVSSRLNGAVGSSKMTIFASWISALAIRRSCFSAKLNVLASRSSEIWLQFNRCHALPAISFISFFGRNHFFEATMPFSIKLSKTVKSGTIAVSILDRHSGCRFQGMLSGMRAFFWILTIQWFQNPVDRRRQSVSSMCSSLLHLPRAMHGLRLHAIQSSRFSMPDSLQMICGCSAYPISFISSSSFLAVHARSCYFPSSRSFK